MGREGRGGVGRWEGRGGEAWASGKGGERRGREGRLGQVGAEGRGGLGRWEAKGWAGEKRGVGRWEVRVGWWEFYRRGGEVGSYEMHCSQQASMAQAITYS